MAHFSVESRVLRELGERLVKRPEVALLELVKNAYDADAQCCSVIRGGATINIIDDGHGMTLDEFRNGWMTIGTSAKAKSAFSRTFGRTITGEKGLGRFAVRSLGRALRLETIANDPKHGRTQLVAEFDWRAFDANEDLGKVDVPYTLTRAATDAPIGTTLSVSKIRDSAREIDLHEVRTASIGVVTPHHSLLNANFSPSKAQRRRAPQKADPGFTLTIQPSDADSADGDVAKSILDRYTLRAVVELSETRLSVSIFRDGDGTPVTKIVDKFKSNPIGSLYADVRFFPRRKGSLAGLAVDGRRAWTWIKKNAGVAVYDRTFRVHPYGTATDDWLELSADNAKRERNPRSSIAKKHFPMDAATMSSTKLNYMLRLPRREQLVGIVQVEGTRAGEGDGLVASADREGFVSNEAFEFLWDVMRGAAEAIAAADREQQLEEERREQKRLLANIRAQTRSAINEIEANPNIGRAEKNRIVKAVAETQVLAEQHEEHAREREAALEVMSLLGVVAGFMSHEFGTALDELSKAQQVVSRIAKREPELRATAESLEQHLVSLRDFVSYSQGYVRGASSQEQRSYPARPRVQQVVRVFGKYSTDRGIDVEVGVDRDLQGPAVPVSLYNGVALNLFTNALKAVTAKDGDGERRIKFSAWNETSWHFLEVSDTGIGIPTALRTRVFDALFTTTASNRDPLGSGLGLGLALVKRGVQAFGGRVEVVDAPAGFTTSVRVKLPLEEGN